MNDTSALGQELLEQLRDGVRKSQEQIRKGQDTATDAFRTLTHTAQALRPPMPAPRFTAAGIPGLARLPRPEELAASAQLLAYQLMAFQVKIADQFVQAAVPLFEQSARRAGQAAAAIAPLIAVRPRFTASVTTIVTPARPEPAEPAAHVAVDRIWWSFICSESR
ncbi:MAG: hypothetical protein ACLPS1_09280 [Streptosporangiaceae bacterium]